MRAMDRVSYGHVIVLQVIVMAEFIFDRWWEGRQKGMFMNLPCWVVSGQPTLGDSVAPL